MPNTTKLAAKVATRTRAANSRLDVTFPSGILVLAVLARAPGLQIERPLTRNCHGRRLCPLLADCSVHGCAQYGAENRTSGFGIRKSTGLRQGADLSRRLT